MCDGPVCGSSLCGAGALLRKHPLPPPSGPALCLMRCPVPPLLPPQRTPRSTWRWWCAGTFLTERWSGRWWKRLSRREECVAPPPPPLLAALGGMQQRLLQARTPPPPPPPMPPCHAPLVLLCRHAGIKGRGATLHSPDQLPEMLPVATCGERFEIGPRDVRQGLAADAGEWWRQPGHALVQAYSCLPAFPQVCRVGSSLAHSRLPAVQARWGGAARGARAAAPAR